MVYQFADIDQIQRAVDVYFWCFVVCELVAEGGYDAVVIGMTERSEDIGYHKTAERGIVFISPFLEQFSAFFFGFSVEVVAFFLCGGGEEDVGGGLRVFASLDELLHEADVGLVDDLGVVVAVHGSEVDDDVARDDECFKFQVVLKISIFKRDAFEGVGMQPQSVEEMSANETGLAGDSYFNHIYFSQIFADLTADLRGFICRFELFFLAD